jgi:hypothetical protein
MEYNNNEGLEAPLTLNLLALMTAGPFSSQLLLAVLPTSQSVP